MYTEFGEAVTDDELIEQVMNTMELTRGADNFKQIADCSGIITIKLTVQGTVRAAMKEENRLGSLLAIVVSDDPMVLGMAEGYRSSALRFRKDVQIFDDRNAALNWLACDASERAEMEQFISQHQ